MAMQPIRYLGAATVTASVIMATAVSAQEAPTTEASTIPEATEELFFSNSGTFFENRTLSRQANFIFGFGGLDSAAFPERELEWDADALHRAYVFLMNEQNTSDRTIRVPDLWNPYNTSVQLLPSAQPNSRVSGSEFVFERLPMQ